MASVADQECEVEHIIQDAGSEGIHEFFETEKSFLTRATYQPRLIVEKDEGMYDAVNRGLAKSKGDICGYLNCDEQYLPGALVRVIAFFHAHPEVDVCFGHSVVVDAEGRFIAFRKAVPPSKYHTWVSRNLAVLTCATFFRRRVFEEQGLLFNPNLKDVGDADWTMRMEDKAIKRGVLPEYLAAFTETKENRNLSAEAEREKARLVASAPLWARSVKPVIVACHRARRLLAGAYFQKPFSYDIYTRQHPERRTTFHVLRPTSRWRR